MPYTLALLNFKTKNQLDLYKIWKEQAISETLKSVLYDMMVEIEANIKRTAPGGLYGEWAKKEECWQRVKQHNFRFDLSVISLELVQKIVLWDRRNKRLKDHEYRFMADIVEGKRPLTEEIKKIACSNLEKAKLRGFRG